MGKHQDPSRRSSGHGTVLSTHLGSEPLRAQTCAPCSAMHLPIAKHSNDSSCPIGLVRDKTRSGVQIDRMGTAKKQHHHPSKNKYIN